MDPNAAIWTMIAFVAMLYMLPWLIAWARGHNNAMAIFAANLLLGWTTIGWVGTLIWSLTCNVRKEEKA